MWAAFEYVHVVPPIPPPFSTPWLLYRLLGELWGLLCGGGGGGGGAAGAERAAEALYRVAAARPSLWDAHGPHGSLSLPKKYVQTYLERSEDEQANTPLGMFRKVQDLVNGLDERVAQQFERLDTQLGGNRTALPPNDEELKATLGALLARLERSTTAPRPSDGYGFTSRAAGARLDARSFGLGSMLGGRDATTAAAPISRPAGGI